MGRLAIAANGLRKSYGDKVVLGVDLAVPEGTIFSLLGPNGGGKTTTVKILSTLISPDTASGEIRVGELGSGTADLYTAIGKWSSASPGHRRPAGRAHPDRPGAQPPAGPRYPRAVRPDRQGAPAATAVTSSSAAPDPDAAPTVPTSPHPARETASALA